MAGFTSHPNQRSTFYTHDTRRSGFVEKIAVIASVAAIAVFIIVDLVRTAPPDAPMPPTSFDAKPDARWAQPMPKARDQRAADESAVGSRPASVH